MAAGGAVRIAILASATQAVAAFKAVGDSATAAGKKIGAAFNTDKAKKAGEAFDKMKGPAAVAFGGIAVGAFKAGQDAAEMSDTISALGINLGASAGDITKFADTAATSLGISRQSALDAGVAFGNVGKTAGLQGPELTKFTTDLIGRAGDVASQLGGTSTEAVEAFGSALRGEFEPARKYNVVLNENAVKAEALAMGLVKVTKNQNQIAAAQVGAKVAQVNLTKAIAEHGPKSLEAEKAQAALGLANDKVAKAMEGATAPITDQQKALAIQSAILRQTSAAQGDFANTADSAKNKQQTFKAQLADTSASLGESLLPAMAAVAGKLTEMAKWIEKNQTAFKAIVVVVAAVAAVILLVNGAMMAYTAATTIASAASGIWAGIQWVLNLAFLAFPLTWIIVGIIALVAVIILIAKKTTWFQTAWRVCWTAIKTAFAATVKWLVAAFKNVWAFLVGAAKLYFTVWVTIFKVGLAAILGVWSGIKKVAQFVVDMKNKIMSLFSSAQTWLANVGKAIIAGFKESIRNSIAGAVLVFTTIKDRILGALSAHATWLSDVGRNIVGGLLAGVKGAFTWIKDEIEALGALIPDWLKKKLGIASDSKVTTRIGKFIGGGLVKGLAATTGKVKAASTKLAGVVTGTLDGAKGSTLLTGYTASAAKLSKLVGKSRVAVNRTPLDATPAGGTPGGALTVNFNGLQTDPAEAGRQVVKAVKAHERAIGRQVLA